MTGTSSEAWRRAADRALDCFRRLVPHAQWRVGTALGDRDLVLVARWRGRTAQVHMTRNEAHAADPAYDWVRGREWAVRDELGCPR